ncbi:MAG TPA: TetR/AcrR family transcriptional regulator [Ilumatobacter sp.]|nr:TetR/AcrR family transcriptional regulator [Ilumatobacter sp.]
MGSKYHHGDLPNALRCAAREVIDERGLGNFSLREVARRAGVSHTAPAHHFGDMQGLLTSLATEGFEYLHQALSEAIEGIDDPIDRLNALGVAYIRLGRDHKAHTEVMFRTDLVDADDVDLQTAGLHAYGMLYDCLTSLFEAEDLDVDIDDATALCWSAMQGLIVLEPKFERMCDLRSTPMPPIEEMVGKFTDFMVNGFRGHRKPATS